MTVCTKTIVALSCEVPAWEGKNGKELYAFKFCSAASFKAFQARNAESDSIADTEAAETP